MISVKPVSLSLNEYKSKSAAAGRKNTNFKGADTDTMIASGDKALNENKNEEALKYYEQAQNANPDNNVVYRKKGKALFNMQQYKQACENYKIYTEKNPDDADGLIEYGEALRRSGLYQQALTVFEKAKELDSSNDLANRSILETKNNILSVYNPQRAAEEKYNYAKQNLKAALDLTVNYMSPEYMKDIADVDVMFGETAKMSGTSNIAQYENDKTSITVSSSYIYAAPQVIAAYLAHESVHAKDKDAYTSIREEQDAYEVAAKFWMQNSGGVKDPEMDYAAGLYKKSPKDLKSRVEEIYLMRDPSIAKTSPNHPPVKNFQTGLSTNKAAGQPLKEYNVIA